MPHIKPERRLDLEEEVGIDPRYIGVILQSGGRGADLNYMIYGMCVGFLGKNPSYEDFEPVITALEGAKYELFRLKLAMVEDDAIDRNGEVKL